MNDPHYATPVSRLLTYGEAEFSVPWPDYKKLGLSHEHIPELMVMVEDDSLHDADQESDTVWAPLHAWRALGQLQAADAVPVLIDQLHRIDEHDDDRLGEELPKVFAMIGTPAFGGLAAYLSDCDHPMFARLAAAQALSDIGKEHPEIHEACVDILEQELRRYRDNDPSFNALLVNDLVRLRALKSLPVIEEAFEHDCVDVTVMGDFENVQIELGLKAERSKPAPSAGLLRSAGISGPLQREPIVRTEKKIGRNEPCPCGSGKKYKKCCMKK